MRRATECAAGPRRRRSMVESKSVDERRGGEEGKGRGSGMSWEESQPAQEE